MKAQEKANCSSMPAMDSPIMTPSGHMQLPSFKMFAWEKFDKALPPAQLQQSRPVFDGGLFTYNGDYDWLQNKDKVKEEIQKVQQIIFDLQFIAGEKFFKTMPQSLIKDFQAECLFGQLYSIPCAPHFKIYQFAFKPFTKITGNRGLCIAEFFPKPMLTKLLDSFAECKTITTRGIDYVSLAQA